MRTRVASRHNAAAAPIPIPEDQPIELLRLGLMDLGHQMAIAVERGLDRGVAELRLDLLRVGPLGDQEARVGVPEVVKAHMAESGPPEDAGKVAVGEVVGIEGRPLPGARDELAREAAQANDAAFLDLLRCGETW